ncbi:hypothetical protein [Candidatus Palauibacter sp.]|uniref:hypothetical protein n=1 Tax=Candidatus Palauibacter sp. TaxID=3101350 RepID=UPI003B0211A5
MISRTWTRMPGVVALAALLGAGGGVGQEPETRPPWEGPGPGPGMVLDEDGGWRPPTPADALAALRGDPGVALPVGVQRFDPALAVLRQEYESRPAAELDALANELADLILATDPEHQTEEYHLQSDAFRVLTSAARGGEGDPPHAGSFDALVRVYETIAAEALAGGGTDPAVELRRRRPADGTLRLSSAITSIYQADRTGRGADYLLAVIAASDAPTIEDWLTGWQSLWCMAANVVRSGVGAPPEENPRRAELPDSALDDEMFYQLCKLH